MYSSTQNKRPASITKTQSTGSPSFTHGENASTVAGNLRHRSCMPSSSYEYTSLADVMAGKKSRRTGSCKSLKPESPMYTYASLKDLMTSEESRRVSSWKNLRPKSAEDIPIGNSMVRKAAFSYLQLVPEPPVLNERIHSRVWKGVKPPVAACLQFLNRHIFRRVPCFEFGLGDDTH